ncbi:MAG: hypothetical protein K2I03_09305 [Lachnospiraceae bacterium]|nr:hypothetical protein [Lachnospiraceae bacterium]MDE6254497.1 hypothetical protein [Lachnospiraceae bacterium]
MADGIAYTVKRATKLALIWLIFDDFKKAAQYLNRDIITPADWWFTWCYPNGKRQDNYYDDVPDFKHMNQYAINLVKNQKRAEFVKNAVLVFEEQLLKYLL